MKNVNDLRETLITLSKQHVNTIMPYWSHGQRGRPITLAFYFMTWVKMLERDFERLVLCYKHTNISPAGTSEGTGTDFPLNPFRTAELLGFDAVYENANDMWLTDDFRIEAYATLITIGTPLRRLGEDLQQWSGWEYRVADLADRWCGTSSIMAHKKNPHAIYTLPIGEHSAKTRIHSGSVEDFEIAVRDTINSLQIAREILQTTSWNASRMMEFCQSGWLCIPDLARSLCVSKGLPWRMAHQICATLVRLATEEGKSEQDVTTTLLDRAAIAYSAFGQPLNVSEQLIRDALNPVNSIHARIIHGSTNPAQVQKQIVSSQQTLTQDRQITTLKCAKLQDAEQLLETCITRLLSV
jgi:argininosuccinate lyase